MCLLYLSREKGVASRRKRAHAPLVGECRASGSARNGSRATSLGASSSAAVRTIAQPSSPPVGPLPLAGITRSRADGDRAGSSKMSAEAALVQRRQVDVPDLRVSALLTASTERLLVGAVVERWCFRVTPPLAPTSETKCPVCS